MFLFHETLVWLQNQEETFFQGNMVTGYENKTKTSIRLNLYGPCVYTKIRLIL